MDSLEEFLVKKIGLEKLEGLCWHGHWFEINELKTEVQYSSFKEDINLVKDSLRHILSKEELNRLIDLYTKITKNTDFGGRVELYVKLDECSDNETVEIKKFFEEEPYRIEVEDENMICNIDGDDYHNKQIIGHFHYKEHIKRFSNIIKSVSDCLKRPSMLSRFRSRIMEADKGVEVEKLESVYHENSKFYKEWKEYIKNKYNVPDLYNLDETLLQEYAHVLIKNTIDLDDKEQYRQFARILSLIYNSDALYGNERKKKVYKNVKKEIAETLGYGPNQIYLFGVEHFIDNPIVKVPDEYYYNGYKEKGKYSYLVRLGPSNEYWFLATGLSLKNDRD